MNNEATEYIENNLKYSLVCDECGNTRPTTDFCEIQCLTPVICDKCNSVMFPKDNIPELSFGYMLQQCSKMKVPKPQKYIYVMKSNNRYKIGVSSNVNKRLKQISGITSNSVKLIYSCISDNAYSHENKIHKYLKQYNTNSEWFDCSLEKVHEAFLQVGLSIS